MRQQLTSLIKALPNAVFQVSLLFLVVGHANALSIFLSENAFLEIAPVASTETFDELPTNTKISESTGEPCEVKVIVDDVVYFLTDTYEQECSWGTSDGLSDGPPPVTTPNYLLTGSAIAGPALGSRETISFGPRRFVKAVGFYFHSAVSADSLNTHRPGFLGWQIIVTEINGETTLISTDAYLGAGPTPPYFGFFSESGIMELEIADHPEDGMGVNWGYDNVSRSEVMIVVPIDIEPHNINNTINAGSKRRLEVAIQTIDEFDAVTVDASSVRFGRDAAEPIWSRLDDVDRDGDLDLVLQFNTEDTGIVCGDTEATLTGETVDGVSLIGTDAVQTVGCTAEICRKKKHHYTYKDDACHGVEPERLRYNDTKKEGRKRHQRK